MTANDPRTLREYHIYYEVQMFTMTYNELTTNFASMEVIQDTPQREILKNATLESFLIHTRSLLSFIYERRVYPDDVIAGDFMTNNTVYPLDTDTFNITFSSNVVLDYYAFKKQIDKQIAHISKARTSIQDILREWPLEQIASKLCAVLRDWVSSTTPDRIDSKVKDDIIGILDILCRNLNSTTQVLTGTLPVSQTSLIANTTVTVSSHISGHINRP